MSFATALDGPRFGPARGGRPRQLVVLLHGWGADGNDLIGLAPALAPVLPEAEFLSPDGPFECDAGFGRQWFSLGDRAPEGDMAEPVMAARLAAVAPMIDAFVEEALAARGLGADKLALVGFSQGTMAALYVGLRRAQGPAGILGYSGHLVAARGLGRDAKSRPEILLVHGEDDEILPVQASRLAERTLKAEGYRVNAVYRPGLGHGIDEDGLRHGAAFLKRVLGA
ncbi:MAG: dienelactone hydrolase family protein [Candidatus Odyssella sp.]|nr:dienelactone hydrolase family protein [Candidatus Odyssella sp.]